MTDEEIIEVVSALKANDKTMKDSGISDNLWGKAVECITFLQFENAELKSSLTHANEECLKWHERAQNLLKDSGGSISGYEKKISDLQSENAALRERLNKAVELPCKIGDKVYMPWVYDGISGIAEITAMSITIFDGEFICDTDLASDDINFKQEYSYGQFRDFDFGTKVFTTREAAEARLAELKGEEKNG